MVGDLPLQRRPVGLGDVGRVGQHGVEAGAAGVLDPLEQVGAPEGDVEAQPRRVGARDVQRLLGDVGGDDVEVGPLVLERERDGAAARADVGDAGAVRQLEADLDERLRLGPRDEHAPVDVEVQAAEPAAPDEVGDGLVPGRAAADEVLEGADRRPLDGPVAVQHDLGAVDAEHVGEQELGVEPGRVAARGADGHGRRVHGLAGRHPAEGHVSPRAGGASRRRPARR